MSFKTMHVLYQETGYRNVSDKESARECMLLALGTMEVCLAVSQRLICFTPQVKDAHSFQML